LAIAPGSDLSEIVQNEGGQNDREPAETYRHAAEVTHIRIHRLAAGDCQEGGPKHRETDAGSRVEKVAHRTIRADRGQDQGCTKDPTQAEDADDDEPQQHRWSENIADEASALALNQK